MNSLGDFDVALDVETSSHPHWVAGQLKPGSSKEEISALIAAGAKSPLTGAIGAWAIRGITDWTRVARRVVVLGDDKAPDERQLLMELDAATAEADRFFIFNAGFDTSFIRSRALSMGLDKLARRLFWAGKWSGDARVIDALDPQWCPRPPGPGVKGWTLSACADAFGVPRVPSIASEDVPAALWAGDREAVRVHVGDDVDVLAALLRIWDRGRP